MKVISTLFILFFINHSFACSLNRPVYSLSGPITMLLEEMNLLEDKNLRAISVFHPVEKFSGEKLGGGIFLTQKAFNSKDKGVVFYDTSEELKRTLSKIEHIHKIEVKTRSLTAFESSMESIQKLSPHLKNCVDKLASTKKKIQELQAKLISESISSDFKKLIVFLGKIKPKTKKLPQTIMVKDSITLSLLNTNKIETYDSPLHYVSWSSKLMNSEYKEYKRVGIYDCESNIIEQKKIDNYHYNLCYRGVLIPGIRQLKFVSELALLW